MPSYQTSPVIQESWHAGEFLVSESKHMRSRDIGVLTNASTSPAFYSPGLVVAMTSEPTEAVPATLVPYTDSTSPGTAVAILYAGATLMPGESDRVTIILRDAEVNAAELTYDPTLAASEKLAIADQLQAQGIMLR